MMETPLSRDDHVQQGARAAGFETDVELARTRGSGASGGSGLTPPSQSGGFESSSWSSPSHGAPGARGGRYDAPPSRERDDRSLQNLHVLRRQHDGLGRRRRACRRAGRGGDRGARSPARVARDVLALQARERAVAPQPRPARVGAGHGDHGALRPGGRRRRPRDRRPRGRNDARRDRGARLQDRTVSRLAGAAARARAGAGPPARPRASGSPLEHDRRRPRHVDGHAPARRQAGRRRHRQGPARRRRRRDAAPAPQLPRRLRRRSARRRQRRPAALRRGCGTAQPASPARVQADPTARSRRRTSRSAAGWSD